MNVIFHPPFELRLRDNVLASGESRFIPLAPLDLAVAQMRLEPERDGALELGLELRDAHLSAPAGACWLAAPQHAVSPETETAHELIVVEAQRLRLPAAARGDEEAPAAAIRKAHQGEANFDRAAGEGDRGGRHVRGDDARGSKPRSGDGREVVLTDTHGHIG
jgi:hypothetical protein